MLIIAVVIKRYLDILTGTFMIRRLSPWYENLKKRQIKSPKIYFRDNGIILSLLNLANLENLNSKCSRGSLKLKIN